jgi:hypothetical protein
MCVCVAIPAKGQWADNFLPFVERIEELLDAALTREVIKLSFRRAGIYLWNPESILQDLHTAPDQLVKQVFCLVLFVLLHAFYHSSFLYFALVKHHTSEQILGIFSDYFHFFLPCFFILLSLSVRLT